MEVTHAQTHATQVVVGGGQFIESQILQDPVMFSLLSKDIYSKPKLATVREIICNAWDAHIEAGLTDRPIEITLTDDDLIIRDFGSGIPDEDIQIRYLTFGSSTKRANKKVTGGYGLGAKAPWSYVDMFDVTSYCEGTMTLYNIIKSHAPNGGAPGAIPVLQVPTTESGLKVHVRLKSSRDKDQFLGDIQDVVFGGSILATLNGIALPRLPVEKATNPWILVDMSTIFADHENGWNSLGVQNVYVKVGNVVYPLQGHTISGFNNMQSILGQIRNRETLSRYTLILLAQDRPIIPLPNREELNYNEKNIKLIEELCREFMKVRHVIEANGQSYLEELINHLKQNKDAAGLLNVHENSSNFRRTSLEISNVITTPEEIAQCYYNNNYPSSREHLRFEVVERHKALRELDVYPRGHIDKIFQSLFDLLNESKKVFNGSPRDNRNKAKLVDYLHRHILGRMYRNLGRSKLFRANNLTLAKDRFTNDRSPFDYLRRAFRYNNYTNFHFLLKPQVILINRTNVEEGINRILRAIEDEPQFQDRIPKSEFFIYKVPSSKKLQAEYVKLFEECGFVVHDWCGYKDWMPSKLAPYRKPVVKTPIASGTAVVVAPARPKISGFATLDQMFSDETRLFSVREARKTGKPRTDNPLCYLKQYSHGASYRAVTGMFTDLSTLLVERFGKDTALVSSDAELEKVKKMNLPQFETYIIDWAIAQAKNVRISALWEYNLAGHPPRIPSPEDDECAFLLSKPMLQAVGYPYILNQDDLDALRILHVAHLYQGNLDSSAAHLKPFLERVVKIHVLPRVSKTAEAYAKSELRQIIRDLRQRGHKPEDYGTYLEVLINHFMKETHNV